MSTMNRDQKDNYRCNANSNMEVTPSEGIILQEIKITCTGSGTNNYGPGKFTLSSDDGEYSYEVKEGTWTGNTSETVTLLASAQVRITQIVVTYDVNSNLVAKPTFSLDEGTYAGKQTVTITAGEGTTIYYTTDETNPTKNSTTYTAPIIIEETTTLKAIAVIGTNVSAITEATYTIVPAIPGYVIDFENEVASYTDWEFTNIGIGEGDITAHGGSKYGKNANDNGNAVTTASIKTKEKIATPQTLTCYVSKTSGNTTESYWYIQVSDDGTTWTDVKTQSAISMNKGDWTEVTANLSTYNDVYVRVYYSGSNAFRTIDDIELNTDANAVAAPIFGVEAGTYLNSTTVSLSCETEDVSIYYTLDGSDPNNESMEYSAPIEVTKTTTIKAIAYKNGVSSNVASAVYTIVVVEHAGTEADPYTVADARAVIDAGTGTSGVYATGIVSEIVSPYNSQYGNITYNISDDGTTTADQLQAYRGKSYNGANFTSEDDIKVGDVVVIFGNLTKYEDTYEFSSNSQLVSLVRSFPLTISSAATDGTSFFATMANIGNGNFIVPDGVTVSTVQVDGKGKIIMNEVGPVIPGSKAYLVEASEAKEYTFAVTTEEPSEVTLGLLEDNMLYPSVVGALTSIAPYGIGEDSDYTFYKLANGKKANSVGFYYGVEGGIPFVSTKKNGAFLAVPKNIYDPSANANPGVILINPDDDADGIKGISTSELKNAEVYTLTGVRVQGNLQKGIYIVNGRKQVIK